MTGVIDDCYKIRWIVISTNEETVLLSGFVFG